MVIFFHAVCTYALREKKIELTAFGKVSAWLLNDDNDRNSARRRYILLSSSDSFRFFRVVLRGRLIGAGLDPVDGSICKPFTCVQITHAAFFLLAD